jgi:hypothetical protein
VHSHGATLDEALAIGYGSERATWVALKLGYQAGYTLVELPGALDDDGEPVEWAGPQLNVLEGAAYMVVQPDGKTVTAVVKGSFPPEENKGDWITVPQVGGLVQYCINSPYTNVAGPVYGEPVAELTDGTAMLAAVAKRRREAARKATTQQSRTGVARPGGLKDQMTPAADYTALTDEELGAEHTNAIKPTGIEWLWKYRLAKSELNLLAGRGAEGKTQIILHVAALLSRGGEWPDGSGRAPIGRTLIVAAEDDAASTLVPRLMAMGADRSKITLVKARVKIERPGEPTVVNPMSLQDHGYWKALLDRFPDTVLLAIDPLPSYLGRGIDDAKNQDLRRVIEPFIAEVTRPRGVAVLANSHLNKNKGADVAVEKILGSVAYVNLARAVQMVGHTKDDPGRKLLTLAKNNNAPADIPALAYRIESLTIEGPDGDEIETCMPVFEAEGVAMSADDLMTGAAGATERKPGPAPTKRAELAEWLVRYLRAKPCPTRLAELIEEAGEAGFLGEATIDANGREKYKNVGALFKAKEYVPRLKAPLDGWEVVASSQDPERVPTTKDGKARWGLMRAGAPADEPKTAD